MYIPDYAAYALVASVLFTLFMWAVFFPWKIMRIFYDLSRLHTAGEFEAMSERKRKRILLQTEILTNIGLKLFVHLMQDKEFKKRILKPAARELVITMAGEYGMTRKVKNDKGEEVDVLDTGKGMSVKFRNIAMLMREGMSMFKEMKSP
jgi:hypothetical protein